MLDIETIVWKELPFTNIITLPNPQARIFVLEVVETTELLYFAD